LTFVVDLTCLGLCLNLFIDFRATPGICMRSRGFRDESMPDITWQLCLYPGGKREENKGNVSLFLKMSTNHTTREVTIRFIYSS
jgi:hypothetical protein